MAVGSNWAGNLRYSASRLHEPESVEEVQRLVPTLVRARPLGSRHSFNGLADTEGDLVSLARFPRRFEIDAQAGTVTVDGGARYGDLSVHLEGAGFALHALASLPHISIAGAISTASHGSGDRLTSLAGAVVGLDLVTADGDLLRIREANDAALLEGATVALGALGILVGVTLKVEPSYRMRQDVYTALPHRDFAAHFDDITASCDSASFFTRWRADDGFHQVWLKRRVRNGEGAGAPPTLYGANPARQQVHPIDGMSPSACTHQLGVVGPWYERAPHFRMGHTPSSGAELQSEYYVDRADAVAAANALFGMGERISSLVQVSEIRTVASERWWLSPAYGRHSATIHFTWVPDWEAVHAVLPEVERALAGFAPRPHWAKLSTMEPAAIRASYERLPDFVALARRLDPDGVFRNEYLDRILG